MAREILSILELELGLPADLRRRGGNDTRGSRVAEDGGAELLVDEDGGLFLGHARGECRQESIVDDPFRAGDFGGLRIAEGRLPTEQFGLEGAAMVERQEVDRAVISSRHQPDPFSLR